MNGTMSKRCRTLARQMTRQHSETLKHYGDGSARYVPGSYRFIYRRLKKLVTRTKATVLEKEGREKCGAQNVIATSQNVLAMI